ncbi:hypothetical protein HMPREF0693_0287 [Proteus mirabilis ATCC 29906]|nr:hypothetical protein HMPREF0693_0287 [Proteus mirabilis ATCC 29906]KXC01944.1 hypothetical protein HMPREF3203_00539 [Proteus mirabilis]PVF70961.1 hypothetical protein CSC14_0278 [Proteus mirabilis]
MKSKHTRTCSVNGIDSDSKLNKALWVMTEKCTNIIQKDG